MSVNTQRMSSDGQISLCLWAFLCLRNTHIPISSSSAPQHRRLQGQAPPVARPVGGPRQLRRGA